jgi:putative membrane protein
MTEPLRKPVVFAADDPRLVSVEPEPAVSLSPPAADQNALVPLPGLPPARRMRWGALFWSALSGLVVLGLGAATASLIDELMSRSVWLGAIGLTLAVLAGLALAVIVVREAIGLLRLGRVESYRERAMAVFESDDRVHGRALTADLLRLTGGIPRLARARVRLADHQADIIDGRDLLRLAERELMAPLDAEARRLIVSAGKRVSVVTAISPRAAVDMLFVLINALGLIRRLAGLYGARPGALGVLRLFRQVISHLAVTGGVAVSDSLFQQVIGHGLAARLSARLGEGMVNGLLTARLGLLAIDLVRPLPFQELPRPALNDLASTLLRGAGGEPVAEPPNPPGRR